MYRRQGVPAQSQTPIHVESSSDGESVRLQDLNSISEYRSSQSGSPHRTPVERSSTGAGQTQGHGHTVNVDPAASSESLTPVEIPIVHQDVGYDEGRLVHRVLNWYHIFFIGLSGTLGVGLYIQTGAILRLGGPWALLVSFGLVAILAWGVMQCIAEMLCIWPISGAIYEFPSVFIDPEVGVAVGVAYWFTNSMGFAAIIIAAAGEVEFWSTSGYLKGFLMYFGVPAGLIALNALGVKVYAWVEVFGGSIKFSLVCGIIGTTFAMILGAGDGYNKGAPSLEWGKFDPEAANNQATAFFMCLPIAAFAFVGIEITAATALEASPHKTRRIIPITTLKWPATILPWVVGIVYFLAALMLALIMDPKDIVNLPVQGWVYATKPANENQMSKSDSGFVQAAETAKIEHLPDIITAFIVFTAITAANTALYVASRTLFGLTRQSQSWWKIFGRTTEDWRVPLRAVFASAIFSFVPFLSFIPQDSGGPGTVNSIFDVLSNMSSVSCVMVWFFECWAFLRFFNAMKKHRVSLNDEDDIKPRLRRFFKGQGKNYQWKSHLQPHTARFAMFGCFFILTVANSAPLWSGFHWQPFASSFLPPICFVVLVIALKFHRDLPLRKWKFLVNMDKYDNFKFILKRLQDIRDNSIPRRPGDEDENDDDSSSSQYS